MELIWKLYTCIVLVVHASIVLPESGFQGPENNPQQGAMFDSNGKISIAKDGKGQAASQPHATFDENVDVLLEDLMEDDVEEDGGGSQSDANTVESGTPDCSILPNSASGASVGIGCAGAKWQNGNWAGAYCKNRNPVKTGSTYLWYKACCDWKGSQADKCVPKQAGQVHGAPCSSQGCSSTATCPTGSSVIACSGNFEQGLVPTTSTCTASGTGQAGTKAIATCSTTMAPTVVSSSPGSGLVEASCSSGDALWCYCSGSGSACKQTAFAPTVRSGGGGSVCQQKTSATATVYALCASGASLLQQAQGQESSKSASTGCGADEFALKPAATGTVTCTENCPAGYVGIRSGTGSGGICTACQGWSERRRSSSPSEACYQCPAGRISKSESDNCQSVPSACEDEDCDTCDTCMAATTTALETCLGGAGSIYHPGNAACAEDAAIQSCQGKSFACYYKILCYAACVNSEWKATFCGGDTEENACDGTLIQHSMLLQNKSFEEVQQQRQKQLGERGQAATASLDESLSGKRTCR